MTDALTLAKIEPIEEWMDASQQQRGMRLLIVDDQAPVRSLIARTLGQAGATCAMAGSAEEAIRQLVGRAFDIALVDIGMPEMDGLSLARHVQQHHADVAVVVVTAVADFDAVLAAMRAGAVDYVVKPFTPEGLVGAFDRAVARRRLVLDAHHAAGLEHAVSERTAELSALSLQAGDSAPAAVAAFLAALESRDGEVASHARRVAHLSTEIARCLGLPDAEIDLVQRAAVLHDVGRLTLPESVLKKASSLTAAELGVIKRHPEFGHRILQRIPVLAECSEAVLTHMEHYDGSGHPLGLRGNQIPEAARIIAVANVYDVMTHDRPYRRRLSPQEALEGIEQAVGSQFDPAIVAALFAVVRCESGDRNEG